MSRKELIGLVVGALVLVVGVIYFSGNRTTIVERIGAIPGDSIDGSCFSQNGVKECRTRVAMLAATTTPCAINIGQFGTSTLNRATIRQDLASTSVVTVAKSATQYATTTLLEEWSVTANTQPVATVVGTTTWGVAATAGKFTFGPGAGSQYLVFGVAAGVTTLDGPKGMCEAVWTVY